MRSLFRYSSILLLAAALSVPALSDPTPKPGFIPVIIKLVKHKKFQRDMNALISENRVFIPFEPLFKSLSVDVNYDSAANRYHGFFLSIERNYSINLQKKTAVIDTAKLNFKQSAILKHKKQFYLQLNLLNELFGLGLEYDSRSMKLYMNNEYRFPTELRRERLVINRNRIDQRMDNWESGAVLQGESSLSPFFTPGLTRWQFNITPTAGRTNASGGIRHTGLLLNGDYMAEVNFPGRNGDAAAFSGRWRRYFRNSSWIRQLLLGSNLSAAHTFRNYRYTGVGLTNRSLQTREPFSRFQLKVQTRADRDIEVYRNRAFFGYRFPGRAGEKVFNVPLMYGSQFFRMNIYGPHGGKRRVTDFVYIPRQMVSRGRLTYRLTAGRHQASSRSIPRTAPIGWNLAGGYGLTDQLTVKAGINDSFEFSRTDAFAKILWNHRYRYLMKAFATNHREFGASFSYNRPDSWTLKASMNRYKPFLFRYPGSSQRYQSHFDIESGKGWRFQGIAGLASARFRFSEMNQNRWGTLRIGTTLDWNNWNFRVTPLITYQRILHRPLQVEWNLQTDLNTSVGNIINLRLRTKWSTRRPLPARMVLSTYRRIGSNWEVSLRGGWHLEAQRLAVSSLFRWTPSFLQSSSRVQFSGSDLTVSQRMAGALWYDPSRRKFNVARRSWETESRVRFHPFTDSNGNGRRENNEDWIDPSVLHARSVTDNKNAVAANYRAYDKHKVELSARLDSRFHIPAKYHKAQMFLFPGIVNRIAVPVNASGDLSGRVRMNTKDHWISQRNPSWKIVIRNLHGDGADTLKTLPSGRFYRSNLPAGRYTVHLSDDQMSDLGLKSIPRKYEIRIRSGQPLRFFSQMDFRLHTK